MKDSVTSFLKRIRETQLYCNVGMSIADPVPRVKSWSDALKRCNAREWEDFLADRRNEMLYHDPNDSAFCKQFDRFTEEVRSMLVDALQPSISSLPSGEGDQKTVRAETEWQFLRACQELEYSEFLRSASPWHLEISEWYFRGHLPCGWEGDWPEVGERKGHLIVF